MKRSIFLLSEDDVTQKRSKGQRGNDGEGVASLSGGGTREGQRGGGRGRERFGNPNGGTNPERFVHSVDGRGLARHIVARSNATGRVRRSCPIVVVVVVVSGPGAQDGHVQLALALDESRYSRSTHVHRRIDRATRTHARKANTRTRLEKGNSTLYRVR